MLCPKLQSIYEVFRCEHPGTIGAADVQIARYRPCVLELPSGYITGMKDIAVAGKSGNDLTLPDRHARIHPPSRDQVLPASERAIFGIRASGG